VGGALCLDFINTLDDRFTNQPKELLCRPIDLAYFAEDSGIVSAGQVRELFEGSLALPDSAERTLSEAIELREAMYGVFWAIVKKKPIPERPLHVLNRYVQGVAEHMSLVPGREHFEWQFDSSRIGFEALLWPIARSAAELLASPDLAYVRACASKTCEWLFLDESKNHRRRWCDMTKCGNRAKVKRFYARNKQTAS
jgi:predicted RNA-binding Zn ribbon-like protein